MSNLPTVFNKLNEIQVTAKDAELPTTQWTPNTQIIYSSSTILEGWDVKEDGPMPVIGEFWMGQKNGKSLGKSFVAVPCARRLHALQTKGGEVTAESFDRAGGDEGMDKFSPPKFENEDQRTFHKIESAPKQEGKFMNRWGYDVLLWVPSVKSFTTIFLHSTNRTCAKAYKDNIGQFCRVKSYSPPSSQYTWYLAECRRVEDLTMLDPSRETFIPSDDALTEEVTKFKNPVSRTAASNTGVDGRPR